MNELSSSRSIFVQESAIGCAIVSGDGNTITIINQTIEQRSELISEKASSKIGSNPYKGLAAFKENDASYYFGRETQVKSLWKQFQDLFQLSIKTRVLVIYGPSGCGKSSLVRAGLIPELARYPLPGKEQMRVAVFVPGTHPVEALAGVLARVITQDAIPAQKAAELEQILQQKSSDGIYDGLRRIVSLMPDIQDSPLVILVDQFEEVYSLCQDPVTCHTFIETLLNAASDPTGYVTVLITLRSDFIGEAQQNTILNQVLGSKDQSLLVRLMEPNELRSAIATPASNAGYPLDEYLIDRLVEDTKGREGALPLLQFALTRVWEGLITGQNPTDTYWEMGQVGGALADEAQRLYDSLNPREQKIAQRVFLRLVKIKEGVGYARRRVNVEDLTSYLDDPEMVKKVIHLFSSTNTRLITLSSTGGTTKTVEVTHEALFEHWNQLKDWLDHSRGKIQFQYRLEDAANLWEGNNRLAGYLWRPPALNTLCQYYLDSEGFQVTQKELDFFHASLKKAKQKAFAEEMRRTLDQNFIFDSVDRNVSLLPPLLSEAIATCLVNEILKPQLQNWRDHRIATMSDLDQAFAQQTKGWLESDAAERVQQEQVLKWLKPILEEIEDQTNPVCCKYGLPPGSLGAEAFFPNLESRDLSPEIDTDPGDLLRIFVGAIGTLLYGGGGALELFAIVGGISGVFGLVYFIGAALLLTGAIGGWAANRFFAKRIETPDWIRKRLMSDDNIEKIGQEYKRQFINLFESAYADPKLLYKLVRPISEKLEQEVKEQVEIAKPLIPVNLKEDAEEQNF